MSEVGTALPESESEKRNQRESDLERFYFKVVVRLMTLGALVLVLLRIYKAIESSMKAANEVRDTFGLLALLPKSRRRKQRRIRIAAKR